jgi:hypothetical protein
MCDQRHVDARRNVEKLGNMGFAGFPGEGTQMKETMCRRVLGREEKNEKR